MFGKKSKEKITKVGRGRLGREDRSSKRNYPLSVLDTMAGKGSFRECWLECTKAWQQEGQDPGSEVRK